MQLKEFRASEVFSSLTTYYVGKLSPQTIDRSLRELIAGLDLNQWNTSDLILSLLRSV